MKKVRSYTSIWSVEKVLYAINDLNLPFPVTFTQMTWFILSLFFVMIFANIPPLSLIDGVFLKFLGIPAAITWFMSQKTFDGKKPIGFCRSVIQYVIAAKTTFANRHVKLTQELSPVKVTYVWSVKNEISN
ncbi:conjugal transfer protein [Furfurilactobacillus milii]|uniref:Conjugal transfer protein n=1 Tax=Furfurilactobacillus milii TaxID=2888272 RepID=A0A6N9HZQ2_9LACO|nr:conjugal transfer protein [Furfurilactobacillus milii]MYV16059.1 conjugal transfer protein [Furfurilactobacillus milii]